MNYKLFISLVLLTNLYSCESGISKNSPFKVQWKIGSDNEATEEQLTYYKELRQYNPNATFIQLYYRQQSIARATERYTVEKYIPEEVGTVVPGSVTLKDFIEAIISCLKSSPDKEQ